MIDIAHGTVVDVERFTTFAYWSRASGDIDPVYPVLRQLLTQPGLDDDPMGLVFCYVAFYSLPAALDTWLDGWRPGRKMTREQMGRRTGVERRGHRDLRVFERHVASLGERARDYGSLRAWLEAERLDEPRAEWRRLQTILQEPYGNGRWAAYKTGEILTSVLGWPARPTDAGHANSTGPRQGLAEIAPDTASIRGTAPAAIADLDRWTEAVGSLLEGETGEPWPVEQVETVLCDWHAVRHGSYYVGHDIDLLLAHTWASSDRVRPRVMAARADVFEPRWLGECSGWDGVRRNLKTLYHDQGEICWWSPPPNTTEP